jgi:mannose-6-phosphate isomerase-like protein (cupin superfamily)
MICRRLDEGEQFLCAGNLYTMLIPRDDTQCFEAALESVAPGRATPPNAHATFVQMYFVVAGRARIHIGGETAEIAAPAVAYVPLNTQHHVENIGDSDLQYIYVSIWPGRIPHEDGLQWREACDAMIRAYESKGYSARPKL